MSTFTYSISGKDYSVQNSLLIEAVERITEGEPFTSRDDLRVIAAKEAFFLGINAVYYSDGSRSYCHYLSIDGVRVWQNHWDEGTQGDFDLGDFYERLSEHLTQIGAISPNQPG